MSDGIERATVDDALRCLRYLTQCPEPVDTLGYDWLRDWIRTHGTPAYDMLVRAVPDAVRKLPERMQRYIDKFDPNSDAAWHLTWWRDEIERALADSAQPEGYVLVPKEPTEAMLRAVKIDEWGDRGEFYHWMKMRGNRLVMQYRAMIAAAPAEGEQ